MQVLEILEKSGMELYPEELEFFEAELDTGDYAAEYVDRCKDVIAEIRRRRKQKLRDVIPSGMRAESSAKTPQERADELAGELGRMRTAANYRTRFKQYLAEHPDIDEAFIDQHIALFQPAELEAILMVMPLSEGFLEKYFASLDAEKIARYQLFSERFFIRHYAQMDAEIVLTRGKNDWRKKENRSAQLDVFLRLKGVKL